MDQQMMDYVREYFEKTDPNATELKKVFPFRNRFEHSLRVYEWAKRINEVEKGDVDIVEIAALFHDIGKGVKSDRPHAETGAEICGEYLTARGFHREKTKRIMMAIGLHSSKELPENALAIEEKIIIDADLLDELGAMCVLWDAMDAGITKNSSYDQLYEQILERQEERKKGIKNMKTGEGRRLYQERLDFLGSFLQNLLYELGR